MERFLPAPDPAGRELIVSIRKDVQMRPQSEVFDAVRFSVSLYGRAQRNRGILETHHPIVRRPVPA